MSDKNNGKPCTYCQNREVVEGTLEGVSFQSLAEGKKYYLLECTVSAQPYALSVAISPVSFLMQKPCQKP